MVLSGDMMSLAVLSGFLAALFAPLLVRLMKHWAGWLLALLPAVLFAYFFEFIPPVAAGVTFTASHPWVPRYGVNFSFYMDGLALVFALLITGIGAFIVLYSSGYLKGHPHLGRFLGFILAFMASMLGLVLADNIITLFVFWELTSITSFLLIGFEHEREAARRAAVQALVVTGAGGLFMLAGLLMLGAAGGSYELSELLGRGELIRNHPWYVGILLLVLAGAFTKSAQVPFHSWLPNAMEAPTPVSAYLHSATMVKAGVYLLMRLNPVLGDTALWHTILPLFGGLTLLGGTLLAVRQTDLKLLLAYTTVASLGLLVLLTGLGSDKALIGATAYLFAHSLFKGALFMVAGAVDHETGTRDITRLGGLARAMPITAAAALLAGLSMGGFPPFVGFLAKEALYAGLHLKEAQQFLAAATLVTGNALMLAAGLAVALKPFWGKRPQTPKRPHEAPPSLLAGPAVLAGLSIALAFFQHVLAHDLLAPMAGSLAGRPVVVELHFWAGVNTAFVLSATTIGAGLLLYAAYDTLRARAGRGFDAIGWGPDRGYDQVISALTRLAHGFNMAAQSGRMRIYMRMTFLAVAAVLLVPALLTGAGGEAFRLPDLHLYEWGVFALAAIGVLQVILARKRLTAIISLGIQGFAVALIFMLFGAPDLSFTQFMIETLTVVILALVLTRLPLDERDRRERTSVIFDGVLAIAVGAGFALLLHDITREPLDMRLSEFFTKFSATLAHGRNIVNVILVDFRALDTLGEITVVLMAGLSALALIRLKAKRTQAFEKAELRRAMGRKQRQLPETAYATETGQ